MHALRHRHIPLPKCRPDFSMSKAGCNLAKQRLHPRFFLDYLTASASHLQRTFSKSHRILYKISSISLFHFYLEYFLHYTSKNHKLQQISDFTVPWKFLVSLATWPLRKRKMGFAQSRIPSMGIQTDVVPISRQRKISQNAPFQQDGEDNQGQW